MKRLAVLLAVAAVLAPGTATAGKYEAQVGFNRDFDFGAIRSFTYVDTIETSVADEAPPVHEMIKLLIIKRFQDAGLERVEDGADICVTYHTNSQTAMRMNTTLYEYHYSAGWWWSPYWGSGMDVAAFSRGTLVVDVWDADTEELIWRGAVIGVVPENPSAEDARKAIEKALDAIGKEWRKQLKKAR